MAITIILSPLSVLGLLLLVGAVIFGWTAINLEVGNRLARMFKVEWSAPVAAGIGALIFNLVVFGFAYIPCLGGVLSFLVLLFALGGVLVTRFGSHEYPEAAAVPVRPAPPAALVAPVIATPKVTKPVTAKAPKATPKAPQPAPARTVKPPSAKAKAANTPKASPPAAKSTTAKPAAKPKTK